MDLLCAGFAVFPMALMIIPVVALVVPDVSKDRRNFPFILYFYLSFGKVGNYLLTTRKTPEDSNPKPSTCPIYNDVTQTCTETWNSQYESRFFSPTNAPFLLNT